MTATTPRRPLSSLLTVPSVPDIHPPQRFERLPRWLQIGGPLFVLMVISAFIRSRTLGGQLWFDEGIATGIASHSLSALPGILRQAGSAPLFYVLLHFWIDLFGSKESMLHALSLVVALATIPSAMWAGWSLFGRRAGYYAAVLFAFSSFLTRYGQEAEMYSLLVFLAIFAVAGFLHGFVFGRRRYLIMFVVAMELMLYTQGSAFLFLAGTVVAIYPVWRRSSDRRGLLRDAGLSFLAVAILYLPWLPTTLDQLGSATSPWHYAPLLGATVPSDLLGGERVDATLAVAVVAGLAPLFLAEGRRTRDWTAMWVLILLAVVGLALARVGTLIGPSWVARYFAALVTPLLFLATLGAARARVVGAAALVLCVVFLANAGSFAPGYKSDMRDVAGELGPLLHAGDLVISGQPEQTPLAYYYLPAGLRYATTEGPVTDPGYVNWLGAQRRLQNANPQATLQPLVASLKPGQQLLYVRPLTEGVENWRASWSRLVRRRSAQWGAILSSDVASGKLKAVAWAPHNYRGSCCVATSAILYRKTSS
jgi:mannosyltransferase